VRDHLACYDRWIRVLDATSVKSKFTLSEEEILRQFYTNGGTSHAECAKLLPGRTSKQVSRKRELLFQKKGQWSPQEEWKLHLAIKKLGRSWADIRNSGVLPGRIDQNIKRKANNKLFISKVAAWDADADEKKPAAVTKRKVSASAVDSGNRKAVRKNSVVVISFKRKPSLGRKPSLNTTDKQRARASPSTSVKALPSPAQVAQLQKFNANLQASVGTMV